MASNALIDQELLEGLNSFAHLLQTKLPVVNATKVDAEVKGDDSLPEPERTSKILSNTVLPAEWSRNIKTVLFSEDMIQRKVRELAAQISRDYAGKTIIAVGLLSGAFVFVADLLRNMNIAYEVDFMAVSSYGAGTTTSGSVKLKKDVSIDPRNRHVLIIEDLIDTGRTLQWIKDYFHSKNCASVALCCLLDKRARREVDVHVDYIGYECPDEFVVGYGMDFANQYRCCPFVGVLRPEAYMTPRLE
eukprot:TRINITY_DN373_c0_g1_i1.p1 TRINITY_DN373_c0_g1~~TRINITY_DN373_c0_g1_i1.p1  ORF type:complete len:246 (+),score=91.04 TRINITY_DN373_c0_g1_i1:68-805(+)